MSIFSKSISALEYQDILLLQSEGAVENIRLEFKRDIPAKEEALKKIASFANTYGGFVVIGVEQDLYAKVSSLPGVLPPLGFQQQVIQWSYDGVYPPVTPFVSPPIAHPHDPARAFYVIHISESHEAPHFLNGRKGCYVRTDEFSQRFDAKLATYEEIEHLANRRRTSIDLREAVISRARARFDKHVALNYRARKNVIGDIDLTMWVAIVPMFPSHSQFEVPILERAVTQIRLAAREAAIPNGVPSTQLDAFFFPDPRITNFSYLEVDTHGMIFYSEEIGYLLPESQPKDEQQRAAFTPAASDIYVYATWILAWLIFYLKYALEIYDAVAYDGPILIRLGLDRIRGRQIRVPLNARGDSFEEGRPLLDDSFSIERASLTSTLRNDILTLGKEVFRAVTFACGWANAYSSSEDFLEVNVDRALGYLMWKRSDLERKPPDA
jgi:hypothetical protein